MRQIAKRLRVDRPRRAARPPPLLSVEPLRDAVVRGSSCWEFGADRRSRYQYPQLVLTGQTIDADTAERWNLVNEVVEPDELLECSLRLSAQLASLPPIALARSKAALRRAVIAGVESELDTIAAVQRGLLTGGEAAERAHLLGL